MLKGITPQLNSMNGYISSLLAEHGEQTWQGYLLNTQKNTFELLKLVKIILNDVADHLPRGMREQFQKSCNLLKEYFKRKPKGDLDNDEHEKSYQMDYDEVQQYLDNKPEIVTNDDERGELFKFLTMNQQKEKNNQMILESMPRYSFDYSSRFPVVHKTKHAHTIDYDKENTCIELHKSPLRNSGTLRGSSRISHEEKKKTVEVNENEAQTDLTLTVIKEMIECYANANLGAEKIKETCDFATEMSDFIQEVRKNTVRKGTKIKEKQKSDEKDGEIVKEKKSKNATVSQEKVVAGIELKQNATAAVSKKEIRPSALVTSHKIPSKDEASEHTQKVIPKQKPKQLRRQSTNSLISSSRKQIISHTSTKKIANRPSRDMKEGNKPISNSKFSKEKKLNSNFNECPTIMQTNNDLTVSCNFEETNKVEKIKEEEDKKQTMAKIEVDEMMIEEAVKIEEVNRDSMASSVEESKNQNKQIETALSTAMKKHENQLQKKTSKRQLQKNGSRQKIPSNKQQMTHSNYLVQQAYSNTFGHPFFQKNSKKNETTDNTSLPKIEEKVAKIMKNDRTESFKKRNFETSPYARVLAQGLDKRSLKYNNSLSQFNNRSLHLNPIQQPLLSPKDFNRSLFPQSNQKGENHKSPYPFRFQKQLSPLLSQAQRQTMLQQQHNRLIKQIQENTATKRSKDPKWTTILKGIRHYELMHASLCGQNCIHLNKFYDFLKRKNLSMYINRRQLLLHKKNIQINTNF